MNNEKADKIYLLAEEIAKLLKEINTYTSVIITTDEVRITEDLYGFSVK